jgi:hypothetical protein
VEALVALSDCLQRERTAIRILMELLVEHLPELELGPIVPVGDVFDVIAGGEEPFDQVMRDRFERARHIYRESFLPILQAEHGTETAERCQRLRPEHPVRLGCSGCPVKACRDDNRLAKTLLEMRAAMPETVQDGDGDDRLVFLVDWTARPLALDLSCRLAAGRVFQITHGARLAALFGARQAEAGLAATGLSAVLLSGGVGVVKKVSGVMLTRGDAYRRFMAAGLGWPLRSETTASSVAAWCAESEAGPGFVRRGETNDAWRRLRVEVADFVREEVGEEAGPLAGLAWTAWEAGLGSRFLELAVLVDAHGRVGDPVAEGVLQGRLAELGPGFGAGLLAHRRDLVLSEMIRGGVGEPVESPGLELLDRADELIGIESFASTREASPWLRSGQRRREADLAVALAEAVDARTLEALRKVRAALHLVESHHLDAALRTAEQRETREMVVRLAGHLVARKLAPPPASTGAAYRRALDLAKDFAAQGGFVDWCRQRLRAPLPFGAELNHAVYAVLKAADALRREDNRQFAEGLVRWCEAGRPGTEVTPIEQATRQLAGELLSGTKRRLLVVLMDGMSWANAVQLLARLERERWRPIVWRPKGHTAELHPPPVLVDAFSRLSPALQYQIVNGLGWRELRPVQERAIPPILDGCNCVVLAPTAGGKTEAALFPLLYRRRSGRSPGGHRRASRAHRRARPPTDRPVGHGRGSRGHLPLAVRQLRASASRRPSGRRRRGARLLAGP